MKISFLKIEFDYAYLIVALGLILTGHFINLIVFTSLIIIHELGHLITSRAFKYKIDKIIIYPYGGLTKLNTLVNTNINKDLIVAISGLIMQTIFFYIIYILYDIGIIRLYTYNLFYTYHKSMLLFNILPIIPLDGSKIINLILSKFFSFNTSNYLTIIISFITIILVLVTWLYQNNYSFLLSISILLYNIYKFYKEIDYIYNRFLLERYLHNFNYKKVKIINNKSKMFKNKKHLIKINNNLEKEKDYLSSYFNKL